MHEVVLLLGDVVGLQRRGGKDVYKRQREASLRVSFTASLPRTSSCRTHAQSCSELEWSEECFRAVIAPYEWIASAARMSSRKSSEFQVESPGYSTVTGYAGSYLQLRNPGRRRTRLQSVQAGSPPKVIASSFRALSCCARVKPSTRHRV